MAMAHSLYDNVHGKSKFLGDYSGCHCERSEAIPKPQGGDCFVAKTCPERGQRDAPTQKLDAVKKEANERVLKVVSVRKAH
jgi:hypothetical protein